MSSQRKRNSNRTSYLIVKQNSFIRSIPMFKKATDLQVKPAVR